MNSPNSLTRCDGVTRREAIRVGGLSALGLGLANFYQIQSLQGREANEPIGGSAKSCILIWLDGGPSHLETFDPKPEAYSEVRGPLSTVAT